MAVDAETVVESLGDRDFDRTGFRGVRDSVLSYDCFAIGKPCRDMVAEIAVDGGNHANEIIGNPTYASEEIDGALEAPAKESCAGEEEIADSSAGEVES